MTDTAKLKDKPGELVDDVRETATEAAETIKERTAKPRKKATIRLHGFEYTARKAMVRAATVVENTARKIKDRQERKRRSALVKKAAASRD